MAKPCTIVLTAASHCMKLRSTCTNGGCQSHPQIREKNDKFQQRKLDVMFAAAPKAAAAMDAVAADSLAMDMEASTCFVIVLYDDILS